MTNSSKEVNGKNAKDTADNTGSALKTEQVGQASVSCGLRQARQIVLAAAFGSKFNTSRPETR